MIPFDANPFILFMPSHIAAIIISIILFIFFSYKINKKTNSNWINYFCNSLGILLIINELVWLLYKYNTIGGRWQEYMPFELCTINAYLIGYLLLFKPSYSIFEIVYFFSFAGTVQGIITPRLFAAFPHYLFWEYFITHSGIILGTLSLIFRYKWKVTWISLWKSFLWLQVIALFNLIFNFIFNVNYMFMKELPKVPSILDFFGEWPWYIIISEVFGLISFIFCLVPFLIINYKYHNK